MLLRNELRTLLNEYMLGKTERYAFCDLNVSSRARLSPSLTVL